MDLVTDIYADRSAVSPVIGVVLMVAVTVIIAAAIGSTVLGLSNRISESPPQVSFDTNQQTVDIDDGDGRPEPYTVVTITHSGGENINKNDISVEVNGKPAYATLLPAADFYSDSVTSDLRHDPINPWDSVKNETISAGDKTNIIFATKTLNENNLVLGEDNIVFNHDGTLLIQQVLGSYELDKNSGARFSSGDLIRVVWESNGRTYSLLEREIA